MTSILIVDDDPAIRSSLKLLLNNAGMTPTAASGPEEALKILSQRQVDLIILDMNFSMKTSGEEGLKALQALKITCPQIPVILLTGWGSIELAVKGMKAGAADFINKPWDNNQLIHAIQTSLILSRERVISTSGGVSRQDLEIQGDFSSIISHDRRMIDILTTVSRVAATEAPVLIFGESGTGKELIAEAIHRNSRRTSGPFVKVNMGGIATSLFESEMFGHVRGAFTGAHQTRKGRFEMADQGTVFLDELADLDLNSQVKLLRVLQERKFEVLGSSHTRSVDVRVICATNRHLEEMISEGSFREDLFYRINLITLKLPPLRERPSDIPLLVDYFICNLSILYDRQELKVDHKALAWLSAMPWPGNVRQLKNLVERTVLMSPRDALTREDFYEQFSGTPRKQTRDNLPAVGEMTLDELEKTMILKAIDYHQGNISQVARSLGLTRSAVYRRLQKFGIQM